MRGDTWSSWQQETSSMTDIKMRGRKRHNKGQKVVDSGKSLHKRNSRNENKGMQFEERSKTPRGLKKDRMKLDGGGGQKSQKIKMCKGKTEEKKLKGVGSPLQWSQTQSQICQNIKSP